MCPWELVLANGMWGDIRCATLDRALKIKMQSTSPAIVWNGAGMGNAGDILGSKMEAMC